MRKSLTIVALALLASELFVGRASSQFLTTHLQKSDQGKKPVEKFLESFSEPRCIKESKPVEINDARFVAIAQTNWKPAKVTSMSTVAPVDVQLCITNLKKTDVAFDTFKTFGVRVLTVEGKEIKARAGGKANNATAPVIIPPDATFALFGRAELSWDAKNKATELVYHDGTGQETIIGPLKSGDYKLVFWYAVTADKENKKAGGAPKWAGKVVTKEVSIKVFDEFTPGMAASDQNLVEATEPIRIQESKPATVNDVKFVFVAQTNWKLAKGDKSVPIVMQMRITNLTKKDLLFPMFDNLRLMLLDPQGKQIKPDGGRSGLVAIRPISVPGGTSYTVLTEGGSPIGSRRYLELCWDAANKITELVYSDGTGWVSFFGPLQPGRHKLTMGYAVSSQGSFNTARDTGTWTGRVDSSDFLIEVVAP